MTTPYPPDPPTGDNQPPQPPTTGGTPTPQPWMGADGTPYGANQPPASVNAPAAGYPQYPQPFGAVPQLRPVTVRRRTNPAAGIILAILIVVVAVGASALLRQTSRSSGNTSSYTAAKPGPNCDTGTGTWQTLDSSLSGRCQSDGLLLTRTGSADTLGEVFFQSPTSDPITFPGSYTVQIDATIESGDGHAAVGLSAHRQASGGAQFFLAGEDSQWQAVKVDATGTHETPFAIGFLSQPTKTFHLEVDVASAVMTFRINGKAVTTVTDGAYPSTDALSFILSDPQSPIPPSALFANFSYTAQPDSSLADSDAEATATATTQQTLQMPYHAAVPGPGCDIGGGQWPALSELGETHTTARCTAGGLVVTLPAGATQAAYLPFYNRDGNFPLHYSVGVEILTSSLHDGCTGLMTRVNLTAESFDVIGICQIKTATIWTIGSVSASANTPTLLGGGKIPLKSSYQMTVTVNGTTESVSLDGHVVGQAPINADIATDFVALRVEPGSQKGVATSVTFKNFAFTPLP